MMQMVFELNRGKFDGRDAVTCYTCHRGQIKPASVPKLGLSLWQPAAAETKSESLPTLEMILGKNLQAIGGAEALARITSRIAKGSRIGADGVPVPEEVRQKAPNKLLIVTSYPDVIFRSGFNGAVGWAQDSRGNSGIDDDQLVELERDAEFYGDMKLKELYPQMAVKGQATVGGREAYVVDATSRKGTAERLYFDAQTGVLIRRYHESKTALGQFPSQIDYEDFQTVDGIKLPFTIRWSIPGRVWGRKITEIKHNVSLVDASFDAPSK